MKSDEKLNRLRNILKDMGSVAIAFSSGVDSTFLCRVAKDQLNERAVAVTVSAEIFPDWEIQEARTLGEQLGIRHVVLEYGGATRPPFSDNPPDRCYHCKKAVFSAILQYARENGLNHVADGTNADDTGDYRPGLRALKELGIRSPLREAGLGKVEIRALSRRMGLPTWNKPSHACLASRIPYGQAVSSEKLAQIEKAEEVLRNNGFRQFRVRHHGSVARIEVLPNEMHSLLEQSEKVVEGVKKAGFRYVAVDMQGYRTGSLNETLNGSEDY